MILKERDDEGFSIDIYDDSHLEVESVPCRSSYGTGRGTGSLSLCDACVRASGACVPPCLAFSRSYLSSVSPQVPSASLRVVEDWIIRPGTRPVPVA